MSDNLNDDKHDLNLLFVNQEQSGKTFVMTLTYQERFSENNGDVKKLSILFVDNNLLLHKTNKA